VRVPTVEARRRPLGLRGWLIGAAIALVILLLSLRGLARFYTDYLWFQDVGFDRTWRRLLWAKLVPAAIFSAIFFVFMLVNLIVADRVAPRYRGTGPEDEVIERYRGYVAPYAGRLRAGVALFFAVIMGSGVSAQWRNWILFSNSTNFDEKDAQFGKDISFYVFRLPFLRFAASWTFAALLVVLIVTAVFHYLNGGIRLQSPFQRVTPQVKVHLSVLLALMALTKTYQYYLAQYSLTGSNRGAVQGATYTDVNAQLPALKLLMLISVAAAALFVVNIWRKGWMFPIIAVGLWAFISIVVGTIYPAVIQRFTVQPNELAREEKYIKRNIDATLRAWNLGDAAVTKQPFEYSKELDEADVEAAQETLENVRLYDPEEARNAFQVTQEITPFYAFRDVDVDRYDVGDEKSKPALVAVRELDLGNLPDKSWTSEHLVYTHGYGAVAAAADQVDVDQPSYLLRNIPPTGDLASQLDANRTGIYFGERLGGYAVVGTKVDEQEAARGGATTKAANYEGEAGVQVSSFLRKAALAARFGDWTFMWSGQVTSKSRVIYIRDVKERIENIAPFLRYDADPYPVVVDDRMLWVLDAYTITNNYPYSQSLHPKQEPDTDSGLDTNFNYVRNSVKATVDAYDGTVRFYVVDPKDPIVRTYRKAFPELFDDADQMPPGLREHWRYPEDIFRAQTEQLALYHITDPVEFFNKQAIWDIAPKPEAEGTTGTTAAPNQGNDGGRSNTLAAGDDPSVPLYVTMQLPGESSQEFVLQRSFTPRGKGGILSAFAFARIDGDNYGKIVVHEVADPEAKSPAQAATDIESDQFIGQQFTLLDQERSALVRGETQLIPIGDAVLYLRPIWIVGEGAQTFPRFSFVAGAAGERSVLGYNVEDVVTALVTGRDTEYQRDVRSGRVDPGTVPGGQPPGASTTTTTPPGTTPPTTPGSSVPSDASVADLLAEAEREFDLADEALTARRLAEYEEHINNARRLLAQAQARAANGP
jgi:uncharacterized membrane protein (UPF0182 family)